MDVTTFEITLYLTDLSVMIRFFGLLLVLLMVACSRPEHPYRYFPIEEQAVSLAAVRCNNPSEMNWLRDVIKLAEVNNEYKGFIYAIPYRTETVFLHQPWISDCMGCHLYDCDGETLLLTEGEKSEIMAAVKDENIIYTSTQ